MGSYREFLWTPLPSPTFSLLTGQWLDFHQLADYHASRTAALAVLNTSEQQLEVHLNAALEAGCKSRELVDVVLQTFIFGGFPASVNGMKVINRVFAERGITVPQDGD